MKREITRAEWEIVLVYRDRQRRIEKLKKARRINRASFQATPADKQTKRKLKVNPNVIAASDLYEAGKKILEERKK
jgi:hypothetical protein